MMSRSKLFFAFALVAATGAGASHLSFPSQRSSTELASSSDAPSFNQALPSLLAAINQIDRAQKLPAVISRGPDPTPCRECNQIVASTPTAVVDAPKLSDVRYMSCSSSNNYLEGQLARAKNGSGLIADLLRSGPRADTILKPNCMRVGMEAKFGPNIRTFGRCDGSSGAVGPSRSVRPCISENYFALMNNSFDLVSRCLGGYLASEGDPKEQVRSIFSMINIESGMHVNAMSPTGAAGVGQMVSGAIADVNKREIDRIRQALNAKGGQCAKLSQAVLSGQPPMRNEVSRSCDRIDLAGGNPLKNMIYTYGYVSIVSRDLKREVFDDRRFASKFALSGAEAARLRTSIAIWGHNVGSGGIRTSLTALLNSRYRGRQVTNVDQFLNELAQALRDYPHQANSSAARRSETSRYYPAIRDTLKKIESNVGGGSCVR